MVAMVIGAAFLSQKGQRAGALKFDVVRMGMDGQDSRGETPPAGDVEEELLEGPPPAALPPDIEFAHSLDV